MPTVVNVLNHAGFKVLLTETLSQVAVMTLEPGEASSEEQNKHPKSEQILLVLEGEVVAEIEEESKTLRRGDCVIVPRDTGHRFVNRSSKTVRTYTSYAPPEY